MRIAVAHLRRLEAMVKRGVRRVPLGCWSILAAFAAVDVQTLSITLFLTVAT